MSRIMQRTYHIKDVISRNVNSPKEIRRDGTIVFRNKHKNPHRINGPAIIYKGQSLMWYVNGRQFTKEINEWIDQNNIQLDRSNNYSFVNPEDQLYFTMLTV